MVREQTDDWLKLSIVACTLSPERRYSNAQAVLDVLYIRERQRRVQPLVAMGGIGPAVILLAMFLFASRSIQSAVSTTGDNLTARALESDVMSVTILASGVEKELQDRLDELVEVASDLNLRRAIEHAEGTDMDRPWRYSRKFSMRHAARLTIVVRIETASLTQVGSSLTRPVFSDGEIALTPQSSI